MKKKGKKLSLVLVICLCTNICACMSDNVEKGKKEQNYNYEDINIDSSKVRFEGLGDVEESTNEEIVEKIHSTEVPKMIIELDNEYDIQIERTEDKNVTMEEAKDILMKQRSNVKEYYFRTNREILEKLDLSELDITYRVDSYAPFIFAEFE